MKKFLPQGFTLIELLVVITIIAILATIGLVMYGIFLKQARDAKRQSDLRSIQSALEQYFADQFFYPTTITFGSALTFSTKTYMSSVPQDPSSGTTTPYVYQASPDACDNSTTKCTSYCLYANLENAAIPSSCTDKTGYDMEVSPP